MKKKLSHARAKVVRSYRPSSRRPRALAMRSRGLLRALLLAGAAAIGSSSFSGAPACAGLSRHARTSSRAVRMMAYKVPEETQEEWVGEPCRKPGRQAGSGQAAGRARLAEAPGSLQRDLARAETQASGEPSERFCTAHMWFAALFGAQVQGQSGLYQKRVVYLGQEIDDLVINQIISVMLFADAEVRARARARARVRRGRG